MDKIRNYIKNNKTEKAIEEILFICQSKSSFRAFVNEVIIISGEYSRYKREVEYLRIKTAPTELNRIHYSILQLIDQLQNISISNVERLNRVSIIGVNVDDGLYNGRGEIVFNEYDCRYNYPTIDFILKNISTKKLLLQRFHLKVLEYSIDVTPEFEFYYYIGSGRKKQYYFFDNWVYLFKKKTIGNLQIYVKNKGWGRAVNCKLILKNTILNNYFHVEDLTWEGNVESGEIKEIISLELPKSKIKVEKKERIEEITIKCSVHDVNNKEFFVEKMALLIPQNTDKFSHSSYLTKKGFLLHSKYSNTVLNAYVVPTARYIISINPHEKLKKFPVVHIIEPNEFERFVITIGSEQSCRILVEFSFMLDDGTIISTEKLKINIKNSIKDEKKSSLYRYYEGKSLKRKKKSWVLKARKKWTDYLT